MVEEINPEFLEALWPFLTIATVLLLLALQPLLGLSGEAFASVTIGAVVAELVALHTLASKEGRKA